jgi:HEAT repeat protein
MSVAAVIEQLKTLELWKPDVSKVVLPHVLQLAPAERSALVDRLGDLLDSNDEQVRWNVGTVVELLIDWDPLIISDELLLRLAEDDFFSVRSSAAVAYYSLARSAPDRVPIQTVGELASYDEDWYVMTPATSALIRLARTRPVGMDVLARGLEAEDRDTRRHAADALRRIGLEHPAALREDIADQLQASSDKKLRSLGKEWSEQLASRRSREETPLDSYMF